LKSFLNNCRGSNPADPAEVKAILFAAGACVLFIFVLTAAHRSEQRHNRTTIFTNYDRQPAVPVPPVTVTDAPPPPKVDMNARFRVVPASFRNTNFMTRNYGPYEYSDGTNRDLVLVDGKARNFENSREQWFDLNDILFTDLTGDGRPEAIVLLTHLECGQRCDDGGKSLVYVYSQDYRLQEIFKYESGSGRDGCSLKSINVANKQLTLELFDRCPKPAADYTDYVDRKSYYITRVEYFFNGKQLVPLRTQYHSLPDRKEISYGVEINIFDKHSPAPHEL
jgi:hypothetical protein